MSGLTPAKRVEISLHGGHSDRVPFTMYENKVPQCVAERQMRNRGLCIVKRDAPVFRARFPNVKTTRQIEWEGDRKFTRTRYETPVGTVSVVEEAAEFTSWVREKMFKTPNDYRVIRFIIEDERDEPCYDLFLEAQRRFGEDGAFRAGIGAEPLQALVSGHYMDMQDFCVEWMDNRDEILRLYDALVANRRKLYPIVAQSPASFATYGGNVTPEIIGLDTFERYYVEHYNEAAEIFHKHGKRLGCHFDANCRLLSKAIARTHLDCIEAFTPAPDTDMTLAEARAAWPGKVLWINFPSSAHLSPDAEIEATTMRLLDEAGSMDGLIMGITENMPPHRWQDSCRAILGGLERHARENPARYA